MKNNGMGTWLIKLLGLIPYVVAGIEQIHGDVKSGAEKKQLAMEALGLASQTATAVAPGGDDPAIAAATQLASVAIDGVKNVYNASKLAPAPTAAAPAPAPAADAATGIAAAPSSGN